jgi:Penicillin-insensitive murein endopeptidase/WD40-like Beta Propeller Repeat
VKSDLRRALERVEVPEEHEARERAWKVVRAAWAEREREPRRLPLRALLATAAVLALLGGALSPPGRAVIDDVREAIGVEETAPTLFSLPSEGRLLVTSRRGAWIVQPDGAKRLLGRYREASWSPNGRFVVAARANELVALEPGGDLRWSLPRPGVRAPRWSGSPSDTRIAYLSRSTLRVVAGDGTGDHEVGPALPVPPTWRPGGPPHVVAYLPPDRRIAIRDVDRDRLLGRSRSVEAAHQLVWIGNTLLAVKRRGFALYDGRGRRLASRALPGRLGHAVPAPGGTRFALVRRLGARSEVLVLDAGRPRAAAQRVFSGAGTFADVAWSPDGRWLLVAWREADQWVFLRSAGVRRVEAISRISTQFRSDVFPTLGGWCCPSNSLSLGEKTSAPRLREPNPAVSRTSNSLSLGSKIVWRRSASTGLPWAGRLENGVRLPAAGARWFTWDPILKRAPNRAWRRFGTDRLVRMVLGVLDGLAAAHPGAPRIGVGDLSRRSGGDFGVRYGRPGHVSHQNGLDADLYYPRRDRKERPPDRPGQIDGRLAQELVDRFVAAGAVKVFVGPSTGLRGPPAIVQQLAHHDNHLHVRIAPAR